MVNLLNYRDGNLSSLVHPFSLERHGFDSPGFVPKHKECFVPATYLSAATGATHMASAAVQQLGR